MVMCASCAHQVKEFADPASGEQPSRDVHEAVNGIVKERTPELSKCSRADLATGDVKVWVELTEAGNVDRALVMNSSLGDEQLERCVVDQISAWKFPTSRGRYAFRVPIQFGEKEK